MAPLRRLVTVVCLAAAANAAAQEPSVVADAGASAQSIAEALSAAGYKADFSLDSLKEIDRFLDDHAPDGLSDDGGLLSQNRGPRIFALGSYVGEVIRRAGGGQWRGNDSDPQGEIDVELQLKNGEILHPVQRVMEILDGASMDGMYAYGQAAVRAQVQDGADRGKRAVSSRR
jgi:hypothetical protein